MEAYDAQGNHRTATAVDNASAEWLALEVRRAGVEASIEPFALRRIDPVDCYLRIGGRRIEGRQGQAHGRSAIVGNCEAQMRVAGIEMLQASLSIA